MTDDRARAGEGESLRDPVAPDATGSRSVKVPPSRVLWALTLVALVLSVTGVLAQRECGALPRELSAQLEESSHRLAMPGQAELRAISRKHLEFLVNAAPPSTSVLVDGKPVRLVEELPLLAFLTTLLSVFCYAAVAALAVAPRAHRDGAIDLYASLLFAMMAIGVGGVYPPRAPLGAALPVANLVALCAFPLFFWRLSLSFPRASPLLVRHPRVLWPALAITAGVLGWNLVAWLAYFGAPDGASWARLTAPTHLLEALLVVGMALGCVALARAGRRSMLARERAQVKWVLWGIAVAATPYVFLRVLPRLIANVESPVTPAVDRMVELCAPLAFAIAVLKHQLFDIDLIIRRSVLYTVLALLLVGLFLLGSLAASSLAGESLTGQRVLWAVAVGLPLALFAPARRWIGRNVDRVLFHIREGHERALADLETQISNAPAQAEVAEILASFLRSTLEPEPCAVIVAVREGLVSRGSLPTGLTIESLAEIGAAHARDARPGLSLAAPGSTSTPEEESSSFPPSLDRASVRLLTPLTIEKRSLGLLVLGRKASERLYVEEDLRLLDRVATIAARVLDRLHWVQDAAEEALARRATAALERDKSEFLLRVAHDLRTPLTAVRWSAQNLIDGVTGPVSEAQARTIRAISSATDRLQRLVDNLLDVSLLELGAPALAREPLDLASLVAEVAESLRLVAEPKEICLTVESEGASTLVLAHKGRLSQVVANLLDNAIKYSPRGGEVHVRTERMGAEKIRLVVRDRGPGLPSEPSQRIFALFQQGAPSPTGGASGYGLGLHVVKSWTEAFGGTVEAGNHPDGGAVFTCVFPVHDAAKVPS